jgi:predicted DNA-binding protein (MmcQ/YjbR family)
MRIDAFNTFCASLPHAHHVAQWGGAHVWKVGGKVFVIGGLGRAGHRNGISFKCSPSHFEMLKEMPGLRPAPYLASRGMSWIQWTGPETLDAAGLKDYIAKSYRLVANGSPKRVQVELGLAAPAVKSRQPQSGRSRHAR